MKKVIAALIISVLCTGWGWGKAEPPSCSDPGLDGQLSGWFIESIGGTIEGDTVSLAAMPGLAGLGIGETSKISVTRFDELIKIGWELHREKKFENNIRHCEVEIRVDVTEASKYPKEISPFVTMAAQSLAGTRAYEIQLTEDGTTLYTFIDQ